MPRGKTPLKRTRLKPVSDKHKEALKLYSKLRAEYLAAHPVCEAKWECHGGRLATQIHHKSRRGKNLNRTETWMAVCFNCHEAIETNGRESRARGFIL